MSVDAHIDVHASTCQDFGAIPELCQSAKVAVPEDTSGVFSLAVKNLYVIKVLNSAVTAEADVAELARVVEETYAALLASWTLKKNDMHHERDNM